MRDRHDVGARVSIGLKELVRGALISVAGAGGFFAAFVAVALWIPQDQQAIRRHLVTAITDGMFNAQFGYGPFGGLVWPRHTMDCGLGSMMIAPSGGRLINAMSNRMAVVNPAWHDPRVPPTLDCQAFARAFPELGAGYGDVQFVSIDRYIMGSRVVARAMLSAMPLDTVTRVLRGVALALLAGIAVIALWKLHGSRSSAARTFPASYLVIACCLALLYGVHFFDATLIFAPPDIIHFIFILISLLAPLARMRPTALALYTASYGGLTAIFEALTGGIPFALAILPLLLALGFTGDRREYIGKLILAWGCFCVAVLASIMIKKAFTAAFIENGDPFLFYLFYRMYGEVPAATGTELSLGYILSAYRRWSALIALGSANIGTGLILAALGVFAVQAWRIRTAPWSPEKVILAACWLGVAALIAWAAAFLNHTAVHPYYMARVLVVPVIGAAVLVTVHLLRSRETSRAARAEKLSSGA